MAQVRAGMAAVYRRYCPDRRYIQAEAEARRMSIGIWAVPGERQRPWAHQHR